MPLARRLIDMVLGIGAALTVATSGAAASPVPSLEGTWLVRAGEETAALLLTCDADGGVTVTVPDGRLVLADGTVWAVATAGYGTWRSHGFPEAEMTLVFLGTGPKSAAPVLRWTVRVTLAATGQRWSGVAKAEALDGRGRAVSALAESAPLAAVRVLYGR